MTTEVVSTLRRLGIPEEAIERAVERGDPEGAIFDSVLMPTMAERTVSAAEIEARGGLSVAQIRRVVDSWGLTPPLPDQPAFSPREAEVFVELKQLEDVWPDDLAEQVGRVYGRLMARIAQTELQIFRVYAQPRLRADRGNSLAGLQAVERAFARLLPLAEPVIAGVHQRWLEHELAQAAIGEAELGSRASLPGAVEVSFLFCDLKDFTAYADREGDVAALGAIDRFADTVSHERGPDARFTKWLGDGVMLSYNAPLQAVKAGIRIVAGMRMDGLPGVHASVHHGVAIAREGDYFGSAVNLAARLLATADRDELVGTRPVVEATAHQWDWTPAGTTRMRGVATPVELFKLIP